MCVGRVSVHADIKRAENPKYNSLGKKTKVECNMIYKYKENSRFKCSEGAYDYSLG